MLLIITTSEALGAHLASLMRAAAQQP